MNDKIKKEYNINWEPQERQLIALKACGLSQPFGVNLTLRPSGSLGEPFKPAVADLLGYGGSAGGGKSDTLIAIGMIAGFAYPKINIGYFRREFPMLEGVGGAIQRSLHLLNGSAKYNDQKHRWLFPTKSLLQFCHCKDPKDVFNYQSWQFDILLIDEGTQFLSEMVDYLITRNRATVSYPTFKPFTVIGTNPGNVGHVYFRDRFVYIGDPEKVHDYTYETGEIRKHIFIPSKLRDNKILTDRDPDYASRLSTSVANKRTLLEGDWEQNIGQYFDEWRTHLHVCNPFIPNKDNVVIVGGMDWGRAKPFAFYLSAVEKVYHGEDSFYRTRTFFEMYGTNKKPSEWSSEIRSALKLYQLTVSDINWIRADPKIFSKLDDGSISIRDQFVEADDRWRTMQPANNDRQSGWELLHNWLSIAPDGLPYWQISERCSNIIRTLPNLMHDDIKTEDLDTEGEDHAADAMRYQFKHLKWVDAKLGAMKTGRGPNKDFREMFSAQVNDQGQQVAINIDKFTQ